MAHRSSYFLIIFLLMGLSSFGQSKTIEGVVLDVKNKLPLAFATIGISGTMVGTASNAEGKFTLTAPDFLTDSIFTVSYMGYKNFTIKVSEIQSPLEVKLEEDAITLHEVEVRPWQPWDYVWHAMQRIPENYPKNPYMTHGYYTEYISENDVFLKFTEAVIETYSPPYGGETESQSKVLKARRGEDIGSLSFMRDKIEKKLEKEQRKAEKKGHENDQSINLDEEIISASFGGPKQILSGDPLRDTADFLNPDLRKKFKYSIDGYSRYFGEQVIIIGFKSKGTYDHQKLEGSTYISMESDAIIAMEFDIKVVIPVVVKPLIFVFGFGITNPQLHAMVHYRPVNDLWYLNDISIEGGTRLTKKKMFKKNDRSNFFMEIALINNQFSLENVHEIPEVERIDEDKPLEEQVDPDPEFWKTYQVVRPARWNQNNK